ncbi:MAG TPA: GDSL-type esterase/lipase family protein [Mycobacteriales bacterium]|jgi:hypothetical protein|nr:GDSL-type esterase/lipase family protein [Mycobacteriales bacterium]
MRTSLLAAAAALVATALAVPAASAPPAARPPAPHDAPAVPPVPLAPGDVLAVTSAGPAGVEVLVPAPAGTGGWAVAGHFAVEGMEADGWTGYSCVTGSGRYVAVTFAPRAAANRPVLRDRGAWAAVLDLRDGSRWTLPERVALKYHTPGCGTGDDVAFVRHLGRDQEATEVLLVDAAARRVVARPRVRGQLTAAVPFGSAVAAAAGRRVVAVDRAGHVRELAAAPGPVFDLHPASGGALDYLVAAPDTVTAVRRGRDGSLTALADAALGSLRIAPGRGGANALAGDPRHVARGVRVLRTTGRPEAVSLDGSAVVTGLAAGGDGGTTVTSAVPGGHEAPSTSQVVGPAFPDAPGAALPAATTAGATASGPPKCAVPRNDPSIQVMQPTAAQVEWAAHRAVRGELTTLRPPNWNNNGLTAYAPQAPGTFPAPVLTGGGRVPAQVLLGILAQEANLKQASYHALPGTAGNPLIADYYGVTYSSSGAIIGMDYTKADCGYGIAQVTDHMTTGDTYYTADQRKMIATDYAANMAAGLRVLGEKWNQLRSQVTYAHTGTPTIVENWYFAIWGYNTGVYAPSGTNPYGVGWTNNPANADYPLDRQKFLRTTYEDAAHPSDWPYQERVIGWAESAQLDYLGRRSYVDLADWVNVPVWSQFCVKTVNQCDPAYVDQTDFSKSFCTRTDRKCWWHGQSSWLPSQDPGEPENAAAYQQGAPEPVASNPHPPSCTGFESGVPTSPDLGALPANATIVDDLPTAKNIVGCPELASGGTFTLTFGTDSSGNALSAIDFHQIGGGARGHFWFGHTTDPARTANVVTGTWRPPATTTGWQRIFVHVPDHGADTFQADYRVLTGTGSFHRTVNQRWNKNSWVDLGSFNLLTGASVSLSNTTYDDWKISDPTSIAWDAVAFVPSAKPVVSYVAFGDSYSAGEGIEPYYPNADIGGRTPLRKNACHRSPQAYPVGVYQDLRLRHPGTSEFHFQACSGAVMKNVSGLVPQWGEVPQLQQGWLDANTTHVSISIGGNDAGFADVLKGCIMTTHYCIADDYYLTRDGQLDPEPMTTYEPKVITGLEAPLEGVLRDIKALAPNAKIVLVGYPHVIWNGSINPAWSCDAQIDDPIADWMGQMGDLMTQQMATAAANTGVAFADMRSPFFTHEACTDAAEEWINAIIVSSESGSGYNNPGSGSFHPKASGQPAYRGVVGAKLP